MPTLLVHVEGSATDDEARACSEHFETLGQRRWRFRPSFVDQTDAVPATTTGDLPHLRTVGFALHLPDYDTSPDTEPGVREDVAALVRSTSTLAERLGMEFVIAYRGESVGVLDGGPDDGRFIAQFF